MTKRIDLLPCPFCGSKARFALQSYVYTKTGGGWYYVFCSKCYVDTPARTAPGWAAKVWNKRAHPQHNSAQAEEP